MAYLHTCRIERYHLGPPSTPALMVQDLDDLDPQKTYMIVRTDQDVISRESIAIQTEVVVGPLL